MATATPTRTITRPTASDTATIDKSGSHLTAGEKTTAAVVIGAASVATLGVFVWAAWIASQISIPI